MRIDYPTLYNGLLIADATGRLLRRAGAKLSEEGFSFRGWASCQAAIRWIESDQYVSIEIPKGGFGEDPVWQFTKSRKKDTKSWCCGYGVRLTRLLRSPSRATEIPLCVPGKQISRVES